MAFFYPEYVAQGYNAAENIQNFNKKRQSEAREKAANDLLLATNLHKKLKKSYQASCITGVRVAHCKAAHVFYKPVFCGKESCSFCGEDRSPAHQRRISAVIDTIKSWEAVSYLVITIPEQARDYMRSKDNLNKFRQYVKRKLKRDGFSAGFFRWHWAGSCQSCKGDKRKAPFCGECASTGAGSTFHPHLNILLPAGNTIRHTKKGKERQAVSCYDIGRQTMKKSYLDAWRRDLELWFKHNFRLIVEGNIRHNFVGKGVKDKVKRIAHKVRYVTRATLRRPELIEEIQYLVKGYRNSLKFGSWRKPEHQEETCCPLCGSALSWFLGDKENFFNPNKRRVEVLPGIFYLHDPPV